MQKCERSLIHRSHSCTLHCLVSPSCACFWYLIRASAYSRCWMLRELCELCECPSHRLFSTDILWYSDRSVREETSYDERKPPRLIGDPGFILWKNVYPSSLPPSFSREREITRFSKKQLYILYRRTFISNSAAHAVYFRACARDNRYFEKCIYYILTYLYCGQQKCTIQDRDFVVPV